MGLEALARHEERSRDEVVETLRFYADPANHKAGEKKWHIPVLADKGKRARKALEMMGETV